jgi:hypothetical protein
MKRTDVTFGRLDKVLQTLGFKWRPAQNEPPGRIYEHAKTGASIMLPVYRSNERVYEHHLYMAKSELDNFGIADPSTFDAKIQKAS